MAKPTDIAGFVSELGGGSVEGILQQLLTSVGIATAVHGGKKTGEIDLKLKFARIGDDGSNQVKVTATLSNQKPTSRGKTTETVEYDTVFFVSNEGGVSIHQPKVNMEKFNDA